MITPCPRPNPNCRYYNMEPRGPLRQFQEHGCYADTDHIIPQRLGRLASSTRAERLYILSGDNMEQTCRWDHDIKTELEDDVNLLQMLKQITQERRNK
jgi:hypothetical protein